MRNLILIFVLVWVTAACQSNTKPDTPQAVPMQIASVDDVSVPIYDFDGLKPMLDISDDTLRIFNFWATWCVPCVKELPYFEEVNAEYASQKVKVVLVSLDFIEDLETALIPFMKKHELGSQVLLLDDPDANRWIPMVDPGWDGAIPVTLFRQGGQSSFIAHSVTYEELVNEMNNYIKR